MTDPVPHERLKMTVIPSQINIPESDLGLLSDSFGTLDSDVSKSENQHSLIDGEAEDELWRRLHTVRWVKFRYSYPRNSSNSKLKIT